jgi:hypothetical protein
LGFDFSRPINESATEYGGHHKKLCKSSIRMEKELILKKFIILTEDQQII